MRIVYVTATGAVLAAAESRDGDQPIDPTAAQTYPFFNGFIHSSFTASSGILPSNLPGAPTSYQVDNLGLPTNVVLKFTVRITIPSLAMIVGGKESQQVTLQIVDGSNVPQNVAASLQLACDNAFVFPSAVTTDGTGLATVTLYSGKNTGNASLEVGSASADIDVSGLIPVPRLVTVISEDVVIGSDLTTKSPFSPVSNPGVMPNPAVRTATTIAFVHGTAIGSGIPGITDNNGSFGDDGVVQGTSYSTGVGAGATAGFETVFDLISMQYLSELDMLFRIAATPANGPRVWIGLFSADPVASATPLVSYVGLRFDPDAGDTHLQLAIDNGSGTPTLVDTGVTPISGDYFRFQIVPNVSHISGILTAKLFRTTGNTETMVFSQNITAGNNPSPSTKMGLVMNQKNEHLISGTLMPMGVYLERFLSAAQT